MECSLYWVKLKSACGKMVEKLLRVEQTYVRGYFKSCRDPYRKENSLSCSDLVFLPVAMTTLLVGEFLPQQSLLWDRLFLHTIIKQWPFFKYRMTQLVRHLLVGVPHFCWIQTEPVFILFHLQVTHWQVEQWLNWKPTRIWDTEKRRCVFRAILYTFTKLYTKYSGPPV